MTLGTTEIRRVFTTWGGAGAALAVSPLLALSACRPPAEGAPPPPPAIVLSDVTLRHYPKDGPPRLAHATSVTFDRETSQLQAEEITAEVPPSPEVGRGGATLTAPSGAGDVHGQRAEAFGKLEVRTGAGDRGETDGAVWDAASDVLSGESPLRVRGPGYSIDGETFRFHLGDQRLELGGGVKAGTRAAPKEAR